MTPRKRSVPDADVITAAARTTLKHGVENVRLADVAVESGLAAATLIQRFGSREGLLDAVGAHFAAQVRLVFAVQAASELASLQLALGNLDILSHLAFLSARPGHASAYSLELRKHIAFTLAAAVDVGEVAPCDVADQARRVQLAYYGTAVACLLEGAALTEAMVAALLHSVLADYL